jgi:hypothetical protein
VDLVVVIGPPLALGHQTVARALGTHGLVSARLPRAY